MSIDIQKQLDLRPYSDKNIVQKPVEQKAAPQPPADEEKSNAAKWMIGLTATAAIVIGGLYAAKHGHLGKDAEKFAKKIFGEGVKEATNTATPTPPPTTTLKETAAPALALTPLVFARKGISRLIKKPNKTLAEIMTDFQQAGVKMEKKGENLLEIRTGKSPDDITKLVFNPEGTLASIQRATKKAQQEVFTFENNILSKIERKIPTPGGKPLEHIIEFAENGKVKAKKLVLNDALENLPVNSKTLENFKPAEIVEAYIPRTSNFFNQAVNDLEIARHATSRTLEKDINITVDNILSPIKKAAQNGETIKVVSSENVEKVLKLTIEDKKLAAPIARLIEQDIGSTKRVSLKTLERLTEKYSASLKCYGIDKPEQLEVIAKPLDKCSKADFIKILGSRDAVHKVFPGCFDDYGMLDVEFLSSKPGFSHVKNHTTIFDIIKDIV